MRVAVLLAAVAVCMWYVVRLSAARLSAARLSPPSVSPPSAARLSAARLSPPSAARLAVRPSRLGGRGVFATAAIAAGEVIERCPYVVLEPGDVDGRLRDYVFEYDDDGREMLVLGLGSMYNHADRHNASYSHSSDGKDIVYTADRRIRRGEEILISYGAEWWNSRDKQAAA